MNLSVLPDLRAAERPLDAAVADGTTDLNNGQFLDAVRGAAAVLSGQGVAAGDVVALMLPNIASFVVALFAAWRLGAAVTLIPLAHKGSRLGLARRPRRLSYSLSTDHGVQQHHESQ
jgi:non-ribosomal peptide synthetase component E (peptide arylation enzyme)